MFEREAQVSIIPLCHLISMIALFYTRITRKSANANTQMHTRILRSNTGTLSRDERHRISMGTMSSSHPMPFHCVECDAWCT